MKAWRGGDPVLHVLVGRDVRRTRRGHWPTAQARRHLVAAATRFTISATAFHFFRIAGFLANFAGILPLCFTKSINVSAKSSCVARSSIRRYTDRNSIVFVTGW